MSYTFKYLIHRTMTQILSIDGSLNCLGDKIGPKSIASGLVIFVPPENRVLLDTYSPGEKFTQQRVTHLKTNVPHIIMCSHYEDMSLNIPGGTVERGEKILDAVNREWSEEVMGIPNYQLDGEKIFNETHFQYKLFDGPFQVYTFVRIIRSRELYKRIVYEMKMASIGMLEPSSDWNVIDSMGGISVPIFMEPLHRQTFIGFPRMLNNVRKTQCNSLMLCIFNSGILNKEEEKELIYRWKCPRLYYENYALNESLLFK